MFRTGWSIIRRIKCLITRSASGTVPCNMSFSNYRGYLVCCIAFLTVYNMSEFCGYDVTLVLLCGQMYDKQFRLTSFVDVSCVAVGVRLCNWSGKW